MFCVRSMLEWMGANKVQFNSAKVEMLLVSNSADVGSVLQPDLDVVAWPVSKLGFLLRRFVDPVLSYMVIREK